MGIPPKEPPTQSQTHSESQNQSRTLSLTQRLNPSQNFPRKEFPRPFPPTAQKIFAGIHPKGESLYKRIRLYRILIRCSCTTLLSERHTRIFWSECSHRLILLRHMPSFAPVAQHLLHEKDIPFDTTMERTFPWQYSWVSSPREDFNMPFSISDVSVKSVSAFEDRHYFCKIGEGKSHCLVTNEFRKKDSDKDRFSPISEKTNSFAEITYHSLRLQNATNIRFQNISFGFL